MASSSKFLLVVAIVIMCIAISPVSAADINNICSQSASPSNCQKVLNSIPGAAGLDLFTLGKTTINYAIANTTGTLNLIKSLFNKATDPQLKKKLSSCSYFFGETVESLQKTRDQYWVGRFYIASDDAADAVASVDRCIGALGSSVVPSLSANIQNADGFCCAVLAIAEMNN